MAPLIIGPSVRLGRRRGLLVSSAGGPPPPAWSPPDPGGLVYWGDASDLTTLYQDSGRTTPVTTTGQGVGSWGDKSGSGHHLGQATAGLIPTYTATGGAGGGAGVHTDGLGDFLASSAFAMADCTILVVARIVSASGFLVTHYDAGANGIYLYKPTGYTAAASRGGGGGGASFNDATVWADTSTFAQYTMVVDGTAPLLALYRGGTLVGSNNLPIGNTAQNLSLTLAADVNGSYSSETIYSEVLVYNHALSPAHRASAEAYLAGHWGI